jgi:thymidine phosphorylase
MMALPQEVIRRKRDGLALGRDDVQAFVDGLTTGSWTDAQVAALAMAILLRGMDRAETVALTQAMTHSGEVLDWRSAGLPGPVLDKHSTGGVGDKVSLMLAPIVAACGGVVPMVSGRGLGHTGGTLDKLEALPGYQATPRAALLLTTLRSAGCAIVGASERIAPADRRLYAIRDVTATVESVPLITASILSKKLAAGLQCLVMDVKAGNGAFCSTLAQAQALAASLVEVARGAGLPTRAVITDMNQVLGRSAGNAVETHEAIDFLTGREREPRLLAVTLTLAAHMLELAGLAGSVQEGEQRARAALEQGHAAERFARMVAQLGGPRDVLARDGHGLPQAHAVLDVVAPAPGYVTAMDTRAIGLIVVALGGGRRSSSDTVDPSVGVSHMLAVGTAVQAGQPLARVHARNPDDARAAAQALTTAVRLAHAPPVLAAPILQVFAHG